MGVKVFFRIFLMTISIIIGSSFIFLAEAKDNKQVILVLINQLSFADQELYSKMPGFTQLEKYGAKGLLNINSGGSRNDANSYLSIGGGSKGNGLKEMGNSLLANELVSENKEITAKGIYYQQTGEKIEREDAIIFLSMQRFYQSAIQKYPFVISALGSSLEEANLKAKVYGNNDTTIKIRYAPLITMNKYGISYGDVGQNTLLIDSSRPYGIKTNYQYLLEQLERDKKSNVSLIVFDLGDLYRLEQFNQQMDKQYEAQLQKQIYLEMGNFIETIILDMNDNQTLIVASPMVDEIAINENLLLSPIWLYGKSTNGNILTSGTTRRDGIVANIDIAPTILNLLDVTKKPVEMLGESILVKHSPIKLVKELEHIAKTYGWRASVLFPYVIWQIIVLVSSILLWIKNLYHKPHKGQVLIKILLIGMLYIPIIMLYSSYFTPFNLYIYLLSIFVISFFFGWLGNRLSLELNFFIIGFITFVSITIDIIFGSPLMKRSFLGYDPIIGARYYGIGNEYMGVYIGATLLMTSSLIQISKSKFTIWLIALIYILISLILIFPTLGTNAGGAISAVAGTALTMLKISKIDYKWDKKGIALLLLLFLLGIFLLVTINILVPENINSHIGRSINQLEEGNTSAIVQTILRKLNMNWRLIQISSWSKVMITSLFVIGILFLTNGFKGLKNKYPFIFYGFYGIVAGAFVALGVNDSGVVAASTMIIYVAVPMLYIALRKQELED